MAGKTGIRITQRKSAAGANPAQRETLRSLGLRGIGRSVERQNSPQLRGMIRAVGHLVEVSSNSGNGKHEGGDG
jgi:large subunit ribosomal protein L30